MDLFDDDLHQEIRWEDIFSVLVFYIRKSIITAQADLTILVHLSHNKYTCIYCVSEGHRWVRAKTLEGGHEKKS